MKPPPAGHDTARAKRGRWRRLPTWPRQREVTLKVTWRGGPESYWLVHARGVHAAFTGHMALEDVMAEVCNEWNGRVLLPGHRGTPAPEPCASPTGTIQRT